MRRSAATLALLALTLAPAAFAGDATGTSEAVPVERLSSAEPAGQISFDATEDLVPVSESTTCDFEDVRGTTLPSDAVEQDCIDYCTSNGWTYIGFGTSRPGADNLCFCCAG